MTEETLVESEPDVVTETTETDEIKSIAPIKIELLSLPWLIVYSMIGLSILIIGLAIDEKWLFAISILAGIVVGGTYLGHLIKKRKGL